MKKVDIAGVGKEFGSEFKKNKVTYAILGVLAVFIVIVLILVLTRGGEKAEAISQVQSQVGNSLGIEKFDMNWRFFQGFECGKNPLLAINANTFSGLKNIKLAENAYLNCWYQVGDNYVEDDVLPDEFSIWVGSFNPYKGYNIALCCQAMNFDTGDEIGEISCKTQYLEPMCK
jgi:hypothetical protein